MNIERALTLQVGAIVSFPADRGSAAGYGRVTHVSTEPRETFTGTPYVWVTVKPNDFHASVWPSNRLTKGL